MSEPCDRGSTPPVAEQQEMPTMHRPPDMDDLLTAGRAAAVAESCERAKAYILGRQSPQGGFCFYRADRVEEPNLSDTYHAVAALKLLACEVPRELALIEFLQTSEIWGPRYLYWFAFAMDLLGRADQISEKIRSRIRALAIDEPPPVNTGAVRDWLRNARMIVRLRQRFADLEGLAKVVYWVSAMRKSGGGFGSSPNLWDTYRCVGILSVLYPRALGKETRAFVEDQQARPFGFVLNADSILANLDVIDSGVGSCQLLGIPIRFRNEVLAFVMACQGRDGGFSRAPTALPDLELTHKAIRTMLSARPTPAMEARTAAPR